MLTLLALLLGSHPDRRRLFHAFALAPTFVYVAALGHLLGVQGFTGLDPRFAQAYILCLVADLLSFSCLCLKIVFSPKS